MIYISENNKKKKKKKKKKKPFDKAIYRNAIGFPNLFIKMDNARNFFCRK